MMKRKWVLLLALLSSIVLSCNWEAPSKISIKTNAEYNFSVGKFDKELNEYISVDTLNDSMNTDSETDFQIYEYNPNGNGKIKSFLVDFKLQEKTIDINSSFNDMDLVKNMSFKKEIEIPELAGNNYENNITIPDLNDTIKEKFSRLDFGTLTVPTGINGTIPAPVSLNVTVSTPDYKTLEFYDGYLELELSGSAAPLDFSSSLKFEIRNKTTDELVMASDPESIDVASSYSIVRFPLRGVKLNKEFKVRVSGSTAGGTLGQFVTRTLRATLSSDTKIAKATGLTISDGIPGVDITQNVYITTTEEFVECSISEGSIYIQALYPDGWKGIKTTKDIKSESAALSFVNSDFDINPAESGIDSTPVTALLDRSIDLAGKSYSNGNIRLEGKIDFELDDADIVLPENGMIQIKLKTSCDIKRIASITVDLSKESENLSYDVNESVGPSVYNSVSEVWFDASGIDVVYTNTLPEGNDLTFTVDSAFFGMSNQTKVLKSGVTDCEIEGGIKGSNGQHKIFDEDTKIDFKTKIRLPGSTVSEPYKAVITGIELGQTYVIETKIITDLNWIKVKVKTETTGVSNDIDTGVNLQEMFKKLTDELNDPTFTDRLEIKSIPMYLYCTIPDLENLKNLKFNGSVGLYVPGHEDETVWIVGNNLAMDEIKANPIIPLEFADEDKLIVKTNLGNADYDLAKVFNKKYDGNINVVSNVTFGDDDHGIEINREDFDKLLGTDSVTIKIDARMVLPFEMKVVPQAPGDSSPLTLDILKFIGSDDEDESCGDLMNRTEPTDIEDIEKFLDALDYAKMSYRTTNEVFRYEDSSKTPKISIVSNIDGVEFNDIVFGSGDLKIEAEDVKTILSTWPFKPKVNVVLPVGEFYIPRDAKLEMKINLKLKADGSVKIFGDD